MISIATGNAMLEEEGDALVVGVFADLSWAGGSGALVCELGDGVHGDLERTRVPGR